MSSLILGMGLKIIPKKVKLGEFGPADIIEIGLMKYGTEAAGKLVYGDGCVLSSACKTGESILVTANSNGNGHLRNLGTALGTDAVEDAITALVKFAKGQNFLFN